MKLSTVFKAVTAVAAVCAVGTIAYKAVKKNEEIDTVEPVEISDADDETDSIADKVTPVQAAVAIVAGGVCVALSAPFVTQMMYRSTLSSLTQRAIDNGNLTFEELMRLANKASQEVT